MAERIGFIGLGNMGEPMASNLIKAGYMVRVYNRSKGKAEPLARQGAQVVGHPADVAEPGGIVISMLANDAAVEGVTLGEHGILGRLVPDGIHISMSTISPELSRRLAEEHARHGSTYVAAPVLGRPEAAQAKQLQVMVSGPQQARERVRPVLEALGQRVWDFGDRVDAANVVKLASNFLIVSAMEAMAEAMVLVQKHDVSPHQLIEMLGATSFSCPIYQNYGKAIADRRFEPAGFRLLLGLKDLDLALHTAEDARAPMPLANLLHDRVLSAVARGHGEQDWAALTRGVWEEAGLE